MRLLLLGAAFLLAWGPSLFGPFHFDDHSMLRDPRIVSPDGWPELWRPLQTRPLTEFSFWISYQLGANAPSAFHIWNLILHALNTALVWVVLGRLYPAGAFAGTAFFALHPLQAEPVNYVFARSTLLMSFFCLCSLWAWLEKRWSLAAGIFALALLSKEECVTFPFFLMLLEWGRNRRVEKPHWVTAGVMFALAAAAGVRAILATAATPGSGAGFGSAISPMTYFQAQGVVILRYARLLLIPFGFTVDPQIAQPSWPAALAAWALIAAICIYALREQRSRKLNEWFWLLAGLLLLAPSSSIFPAEDLAADRRMYLPLFAFGCLFARIPFPPALAVVLAALSFIRTTQVWQSEETLWREAVERAPAKVRPRIQLSRAVRLEEAAMLLDEAAVLEPQNSEIPNELGLHLIRDGKAAESLAAFGKALALAPGDAKTLNNRGVALFHMQQLDAARQDFLRALAVDPCLADARRNLELAGGSAKGVNCPSASGANAAPASP